MDTMAEAALPVSLKRQASLPAGEHRQAQLQAVATLTKRPRPEAATLADAALDEAVAELLMDEPSHATHPALTAKSTPVYNSTSQGPVPCTVLQAPAVPQPASLPGQEPGNDHVQDDAGASNVLSSTRSLLATQPLDASSMLPDTQPAELASKRATPEPGVPADCTPPTQPCSVGVEQQTRHGTAAHVSGATAACTALHQKSCAEAPAAEAQHAYPCFAEAFRLDVALPYEGDADAAGQDGSWCVGGYVVPKQSRLGSGGLGTVRLACHLDSGRDVALKIGQEFVEEEGPHDFGWWSFSSEWNLYAALALGRDQGFLPTVYEFGLVRTCRGVSPWISMERLGADLHTLNYRGLITDESLLRLARGALGALEALHRLGYVHNDIKPANFCIRGLTLPAANDGVETTASELDCEREAAPVPIMVEGQEVVLVDFGFALAWSPEAAGGRWSFVGTPDFASAAALSGTSPGPRDDLEALGYTLLELVQGELPWDVTRHELAGPSQATGKPADTSQGWNNAQLADMAVRREKMWQEQVAEGMVPGWLVGWVYAARATPAANLPDYEYFRGLLDQSAVAAPAQEADSEVPAVAACTAAAAQGKASRVAPQAAEE